MSAKAKAKKETRLFLRIRTWAEAKFVSVWLIEADGPAEHCCLWGEMSPLAADELAQRLGIDVDRDHVPLAAQPSTPAGVKAQKGLYE